MSIGLYSVFRTRSSTGYYVVYADDILDTFSKSHLPRLAPLSRALDPFDLPTSSYPTTV
jgi:hypothetical protein